MSLPGRLILRVFSGSGLERCQVHLAMAPVSCYAHSLLFLWPAPLSFDWSPHLRLTCGPAGNRTTTGSLSASSRTTPYQLLHRDACYAHSLRADARSQLFLCVGFCFLWSAPVPFGGSHLRLPSGPAGIRTTTGSLSALAGNQRYTEPSGRLLCVGFCVVVDDVDYVQVLHQFSFVTLNSRQPRVLIRNLLKPP